MEKDINPCEWLPSYFLKELTPEEQLQFEQHLQHCESCQDELKDLERIWEELPFTMEITDPPHEMKAEILEGIFAKHPSAEPGEVEEAMADIRAHTSATIYPGFRHWGLLSAAGVVLLLGAYLLGDMHGRAEVTEKTAVTAQDPWTVQQKVQLNPADPALTGGKGDVWLMQQGNAVQVLLQVNGVPATKGSESYQMWMTSAGKRWSCGTFKVSSEGAGVLLYNLKNGAKFDSIGVTLEPDASGKQPRGRKMFGT
jgi:anti-sigma factor RsiW